MSKTKNTKRALISSIMALVVCVSMLVGSTYAWFTDTASTGVNTIQSGTLKVDIVDANGDSLAGETLSFQKAAGHETEAILWEPGATYNLDEFYVKNEGNLALKYKIVVSGLDGDAKLLEAIDFTATIGTTEFALADGTESHLSAGETSDAIQITGHMREDAGNEYQNLTLNGIGITIYATQYTEEYDSFNNTYDANATLEFTAVASAAELTAAIADGGNISVTSDVTTSSRVSVTGDTEIQGNGNTLAADANDNRVLDISETTGPVTLTLDGVTVDATNAKKDSGYQRGISLHGNKDVTLDINNSTVASGWYAINVAGSNDAVEINADNSKLTGWAAVNIWSPTTATITNSTLIGTNDKAYNADGWNDFATIVVNPGAVNTSLTFTNCRIEANATTGNNQWLVLLEEEGIHLTFTNCTFVVDGVEITDVDDLLENYFAATSTEVAQTAVVTIDGTVVSLV